MAVDHTHNLSKPNFISPIMFGANLVMYPIARSKMAVNIHGKLHPEGQYKLMISWLNGLTMEIPAMPDSVILTDIDNDQVILKKWRTVRKVSTLTSLCHAEVGTRNLRKLHQNNTNNLYHSSLPPSIAFFNGYCPLWP